MKKISIWVLFGLCGIFAHAQSPAPDSLHLNTPTDKVYGLSLLWSELKYNFVHIDRLNFDVDSLYRATLERVIAADDDITYYKELARFMCAFQDGHTQLMWGTDAYDLHRNTPPCHTADFDGRYYIIGLYTPEMDRDLYGAEILQMEGMSPAEYCEKIVMPFIPASTDYQRHIMAASDLFWGEKNSEFCVKLKKRDGEIGDYTMIRNSTYDEYHSEYIAPPSRTRQLEACEITWLENDDIAVMTLNTFVYEVIMEHIDRMVDQIHEKGTKGVIIDLRNNMGGITDVAYHLQKYLTKGDYIKTYGAQMRINNSYGRAQGNWREEYADFYNYRAYETQPADSIAIERSIKRLECPVVILIGHNTFSACEDFLIDIYEMPDRPLLIGRETRGSTGAPLVIELPHGARARLCTLRQLYPYSMTPFAGRGIIPDIEVERNIEDYLNDRDAAMERGINELKKLIVEKDPSYDTDSE